MQRNLEYLRLKNPEKKRLRFFSFFLTLSFLFWIITKLSNTYSSSVEFRVNFVDIPPLIVLDQVSYKKIKVDITASGFELMIYHFFKSEINLSLENADYSGGFSEINLMDQKFSLQKQLYKNARINRVSPPQLNFSFGKLKRQKIPVIAPDKINFKPGYAQAGEWVIEPDSVWVYGTSKKINALNGLMVEPLSEEIIENDIEEKVKLLPIDNIRFETESVLIKISVKRFTEKSINAFVNIKNLPDSLSIKLFPQSLKVSFLVLMDKAENITASDFNFSCDYDQAKVKDKNFLDVSLDDQPKGVSRVMWEPKKLDYLIRK